MLSSGASIPIYRNGPWTSLGVNFIKGTILSFNEKNTVNFVMDASEEFSL